MIASSTSTLRRLLVAGAAFASITVGGSLVARAGDFTKACEDNSALDTGKLSDADKKSCACIKAKLDDKTQGDAGSVLEKILASRKAGKTSEKPQMSPDEEKAMKAFVAGMQGCVAPSQ